ncbi:ABC transporter permease [Chitinophaga sancti]|uniref:ABC transporter permease subunit n=1 Tax=Chitinophaga sancti TaxID=1004 RepID=A0A1K1RPS0_9BACT|nr:ABC transporter permease subunit [Chitinophaga sancti]WQD62578.1 ABC transporter permease subunit [Chitinophaga sancti]WQG91853.1 ABC transporter permease subunit [Chitinophaga sancti]SFW73788.1 ABC-2 type transport system permease protein [Chitinophaga sancti]
MKSLLAYSKDHSLAGSKSVSPFWVMVKKEVADQIHSWRFIILALLILLTWLGSMYVSMSNIRTAMENVQDHNTLYFYLKLLTITDRSLPPFHVFIGFLGPLLGIALGFDAINSEQSNGTLIRLMAQPVYRDSLLNAKFTGSLIVISILFFSLNMLMVGGGMLLTGVHIEFAEFARILCFVGLSIIYVAFWLNLAILLSVKFRQSATSALTAIAIWLFLTVFYPILVQIVLKGILPDPGDLNPDQLVIYNQIRHNFLVVMPSQMYTDGTTTLLMPVVRSMGPLTMEQMAMAVPAPLPLRESLLITWPQVSGLIAATVACFAISYWLFMRREIRT